MNSVSSTRTENDDNETDRAVREALPAFLTEPGITHHLDEWLGRNYDALVGLRRYIHAHPELSGSEHGTAALIAERLSTAGLAPRLIPAGNGVICEVGTRRPGGRVIAMRADMDALPLPDLKDVPYRSTVADACHACGHDVHTTVAAGVALALAGLGDRLGGVVRFIFQPSEEAHPCGSHDMIAAGAMDEVDEIYALHCYPQLPAGAVGLKVGPLTGACDLARIRLSGDGGHTARPHLAPDLVGALGRLIVEVPALLARRFDPRHALTVMFGSVHAGAAPNVIPGSGSVSATMRTLDTGVWEQLPAVFEEVVHQVVAPTGAKLTLDYQRFVPPVENDRHAISVFEAAALAALGPRAIHPAQHSLGGEDFSWYLRHAPGAMARLGTGIAGAELDLHRGDFDVDERAIDAGVRLMTHTVLAALRR